MKQPTFDIEIQLEFAADVPDLEETLQEAATAALAHQQVFPPASLTILLTDDDQLQQLNREFRGLDEPTDVLSFPNEDEDWSDDFDDEDEEDEDEDEEDDDLDEWEEELYLGDIAISVPYATRQAAVQGHSLLAELRLLTVHGVLHLLGHDHAEPEEEAIMWAAQKEILETLDGDD